MTHYSRRKVVSLAISLAVATTNVRSAEKWSEGKHYYRISSPPAPRKPGVSTITEVFSYGCPACNTFAPYMQSLEKKVPANTEVEYLPASWIAAENWPAFQRAYLTAKALGVAGKAHEEMFAAVWKTGELAVIDPKTGRSKSPLPSMQDIARFYQRVTAVPASKFIETSKSFSVDSEIKRSESLIKAFRADSTPTLVVNEMYRLEPESPGGPQEAVDLALWLSANARSAK